MRETPASVLAGLPGWEGARTQELNGGLSNHTWLVEGAAGKAVLKIDPQPRGAPFNDRRVEARLQQAAAEKGLAGRVLYATDTVYMTEFLEGDVWSREDFDDDAKLADLAGALRRLHSLPLTGRTFDAIGAARDYAARIEAPNADRARTCVQTIEAMPPPRQLRCCHNDLVADNIIATPEIRFLDWEYACDNDPLFDLATITAHHGLSGERRDVLLDAYFDGDGARHSEQVAALERLYLALLWLWGAARGGERGVCRPK